MKSNYRRDIDGLRALAVISVLLFHLETSWFKGGFLGVDIFFVISGFLITRILLSEIISNNFSIIKFYAGRIVRIFPALISVLLSCIVLGWFVQSANEFEKLGKHIFANAGFVSNFLLWTESGYFDSSSETKPLLHLWSLSVEGQFYLIWPAIIMIIWKYKLRISSFMIICILMSITLTYSVAGGSNLSNGVFYLPITRAWELSMGALLANFYFKETHYLKKIVTKANETFQKFFSYDHSKQINLFNYNIISIVGVLLIFSSFYRVNNGEVFSLFITFPTVIGSCCLIISGPNSFFNKYFLCNKISVFLGLISYPLYLWHWPLLSLSKYLNLSSVVNLFLILIAFILSWLTYFLIESPIRKNHNKRKTSIFLIIVMLLTAALGFLIVFQKGFPFRYQSHEEYTLNGDLRVKKIIKMLKCNNATGVVDSWCHRTSTPKTILIGDSHIDQLRYMFIENGNENFSKLISQGAGNCPPLLGSNPEVRCTKQMQHTLKSLELYPELEYAIISSWNTQYGDPEKAIIEFKPVIEKLREKGLKIAIIVDNPTLKNHPRECSLAWPKLKLLISKPPEYCSSPTIENFKPYKNYATFIKKIQKIYPDIFVFDTLKIFCKGLVCNIRSGKIMNYIDEGHISPYLGKKIVDTFVQQAKLTGFYK